MFHVTIKKQLSASDLLNEVKNLKNKHMKHPCKILDTQGDDY